MKIVTRMIAGSVALAAALTMSPSAQAQNLLIDPGFESGAFPQGNPIPVPAGVGGGWAAFGASVSTTVARSGSDSASIDNNSWNPQGVYQLLAAAPGQTFDLTAYYMTPTGSGSGGVSELVQISFFDSTGAGVGTPTGPWIAAPTQLNTWIQAPDVIATAPAGTAYVGAYLMWMDNDGSNGDKMFYDDASLTATPEPSILALLGLGLAVPFGLRRRNS